MASTSGECSGFRRVTDREIREIITNSDSESDDDFIVNTNDSFSDSEEDKSDNHDSESDSGSDNSVVGVGQVHVRPRNKRRRIADDGARNWIRGDFQPTIHDFDSSSSGISAAADLTEESSEFDCFSALFTTELVEAIVEQTNSFYKFVTDNTEFSVKSRITKWKDTTVSEMYVFLHCTC